ncbi:hypothetical protein [Nocardia aurea]|uniref:hypothetical protein n=1 Tax=Nocardia aurea TaxID=2144174 RepID=UPI0033B40FC8
MSEHTVELVKYAIQLPDSDLADDFVGDRNNAYLWTLPDGKRVYVWDDADDARKCFERIATEVEFHGCRELFQQHATVVRIDIRTVHTMDVRPVADAGGAAADSEQPAPTPDYYTMPAGLERDVRSLLSILEEGSARSVDGRVVAAPVIEKLREALATNSTGARTARVWDSVRAIPEGVEFRVVGSSRYRPAAFVDACVLVDGDKVIPFTEFRESSGAFVEVTA